MINAFESQPMGKWMMAGMKGDGYKDFHKARVGDFERLADAGIKGRQHFMEMGDRNLEDNQRAEAIKWRDKAAQYKPYGFESEVFNWDSEYRNPYLNMELLGGRDKVEGLNLPEEQILRMVESAKATAGTVSSDPRLKYRQPDTVEANAEFVGQYMDALLRMAPYYDLPPETLAGIIMQESGWGGQRFGGNLGGYGFDGDGSDKGYRFVPEGADPEVFDPRMVAMFLEAMSNEATSHFQPENYRYRGARTPHDFVYGGDGFVGGYNNPTPGAGGDPNWAESVQGRIDEMNYQPQNVF